MMRITDNEFKKLKSHIKNELIQNNPPKASKYRNKRVSDQGINFDSKLEFNLYIIFKSAQQRGEISYFLMQVPFHLPAGVKYIVDFVVFFPDGTVRYYDAKGVRTAIYRLKKKQVEALYPVMIEEIERQHIKYFKLPSCLHTAQGALPCNQS